MSQLVENVKADYGEPNTYKPEGTLVNSSFKPLIFQPREGVWGGLCL
jgi:hypothetical protein